MQQSLEAESPGVGQGYGGNKEVEQRARAVSEMKMNTRMTQLGPIFLALQGQERRPEEMASL